MNRKIRLPVEQKFEIAGLLRGLSQEKIDAEKITRDKLAKMASEHCKTIVTVRHIDGVIEAAKIKIKPWHGQNPRTKVMEKLATVEKQIIEQQQQIHDLRRVVYDLLEAKTAPTQGAVGCAT
jgi:hypothetical protein